jgi:two-component system chemotaxis response regulator CheY
MNMGSNAQRDLRILIADDHLPTRTLVKLILRECGFQDIRQAESGAEALHCVMSEPVDLIICDWNMPEGNGLQVLRMLRADPRFEKIPFLMLTAEAYRENVLAAMQAGVSDYVIKPFTADILFSKISEIVSRQKALRH